MDKAPSILDEMIADLLVNQEDGSITILHDRPFDDVLLSLEYDEKDGTLLFVFQNKKQYFGLELLDDYADYFYDSKTITILQIDMEKDKAVAGLEVPLKFIENSKNS